MTALRNHKAPASAPGGLVWDTTDQIVEVPQDLAGELLAIVDGGFVEVQAKAKVTEPAPDKPSRVKVTE
jgi:hypothetical protein